MKNPSGVNIICEGSGSGGGGGGGSGGGGGGGGGGGVDGGRIILWRASYVKDPEAAKHHM